MPLQKYQFKAGHSTNWKNPKIGHMFQFGVWYWATMVYTSYKALQMLVMIVYLWLERNTFINAIWF